MYAGGTRGGVTGGKGRIAISVVNLYGLLAIFLLLPLTPLHAASSPVIINEIMWDGTEYIELHNTTLEAINLAGWTLTRQQLANSPKAIVTFTESDSIAAGGFYLVAKNEAATSVMPDKVVSSLTLVNTGELVTLTNAEAALIDSANQLGEWFAGRNTETGSAMERTATSLDGTLATSWHTAATELNGRVGTPGAANSAPPVNLPPAAAISGPTSARIGELVTYSAEDSSDAEDDELTFTWSFSDGATATGLEVSHTFTAAGNQSVSLTVSDGAANATAQRTLTVTAPTYSDQIVINEVLPNPVGSDTSSEFIELKNIGSLTVDLGGWQLDDQEGGSVPYTIAANTTLAPGALKVLTRAETKLALNNDTDTVRLLDPTGHVRATTTYTNSPKEGASHNRLTSGQYQLSATPTSGGENTITSLVTDNEEESEEEETATTSQGRVASTTVTAVPLADVRQEEVGTLIQTEGVVSLPPGSFGKTMFYLAGSGIQVYSSPGAFPALKLGDHIRVVGKLSTNQGEARLKLAQATDITVLKTGSPPSPHRIETGAVDEAWEGSLVIIQGHVTETSGNTFFIDDGSGEVKVFIKETAKIDKPRLKKGTAITITGIVSETRSGYRVLPRFQEDIRLGLVAGLTSFPATGTPTILVSLLVLSTVLLYIGYRHHEPLLTRGL